MVMQYNDPAGGSQSDVSVANGTQFNQHYYEKKALIEAAKLQFFGQLADVTSMPKNMGKKIKRYHYIPLLDAANLNDQGIDAAGVTIATTGYNVTIPSASVIVADASAAATAAAINDNVATVPPTVATAGSSGSGGSGLTEITVTGPLTFTVSNLTKADAVVARNIGASYQQASGNLYGSSKDIGTINGRMPVLSETGGRVNRVGFKRKELEGTLEKFGFFDEYTQESMDFDTDAELEMHITREMVMGANEMTEDALQIDLITAAGVVKYTGSATAKSGLKTTNPADELSYGDLMRISIDLDNNRTPKQTKVITGSRMVDTKTVAGARIAYIGSEMLPTLKAMKDLHDSPAWIPVQRYAEAGNTVNGEEGAIDNLRFVVVPEMVKFAGAGADATGNSDSYKTGGRFDVFPILIVGDESFTTIGFQTDGKTTKFKITHKKPGEGVADRTDPYGETGFMSIKWYYGFMALRPERIGLILTAAKL
jgi:N4-gp56 family major capsid protein